jgi:hypothetical protein
MTRESSVGFDVSFEFDGQTVHIAGIDTPFEYASEENNYKYYGWKKIDGYIYYLTFNGKWQPAGAHWFNSVNEVCRALFGHNETVQKEYNVALDGKLVFLSGSVGRFHGRENTFLNYQVHVYRDPYKMEFMNKDGKWTKDIYYFDSFEQAREVINKENEKIQKAKKPIKYACNYRICGEHQTASTILRILEVSPTKYYAGYVDGADGYPLTSNESNFHDSFLIACAAFIKIALER